MVYFACVLDKHARAWPALNIDPIATSASCGATIVWMATVNRDKKREATQKLRYRCETLSAKSFQLPQGICSLLYNPYDHWAENDVASRTSGNKINPETEIQEHKCFEDIDRS